MRKILAIVAVFCGVFIWSITALAAGANETRPIGAFPSDWLDFTEDLYPISQQPRPIQWQAWVAVQAAIKGKGEMILIEAHESSRESAEKVLRYLVDHHKFPENRFVVTTTGDPGWKGWVTVRAASSALPPASPQWEIPAIRTSLASPMSPEEAAKLYRYSESRDAERSRLFRIRPGIGIQWFNLQTDPDREDRWTASWLGIRGAGESTIYENGGVELGTSASYYTSLTGLNEESFKGRISTVNLGAYGAYHFEPSALGMLEARLDTGFHGTWRRRLDGPAFSPPVRAPFLKGTISTSFDEAIRLGTSFGYVFESEGVLQAGGFLKHRIFSNTGHQWDAAFGLDLSLARFRRGGDVVQESWSTVQVGFVGSI